MTGVLRALGMNIYGNGNRVTIKKHIERLGLDTGHWTGARWNKGRTVGPKRPIEEYLVQGITLPSSSRFRKRLVREGLKDEKCEWCGLEEWMGEPAPLQLDHVNGDRRDNRLTNLRVLCANCHALTPTHSKIKT